jgi:outer membrane protease
MIEARITDQACRDCFEELWRRAFEWRPFNAICTLLRVAGLQDAGWDRFEDSKEAFKDYSWHLKAQPDDLSDKSQWRVGLLMYCNACEMSAVHATLANLLRIHLGQPYLSKNNRR